MLKKYLRYLPVLLLFLGAGYFYYSRLPRFRTGQMAPDFTLTMPGQPPVRLSDFRGKMVLVHFWGTWCGPCRKENPELVKLYSDHHAKGFEIVSIAVERNTEVAWKNVITASRLNWPYHVLESGYFDGPITTLFNVHEIPATFLVDKNGQIVATNASPAVLHKILLEQLLTI